MALPQGGRVGGYPWNGYPPCAQRGARPTSKATPWAASFLAFGRPATAGAEGLGPTGISSSPTPCQKRKMPSATHVLTYWTLSAKTRFHVCKWIGEAYLKGTREAGAQSHAGRSIMCRYSTVLLSAALICFGQTLLCQERNAEGSGTRASLVEIDDSPLDRSLNGGVVSYAASLEKARSAVVSVYSTKSLGDEDSITSLHRRFLDPHSFRDFESRRHIEGMGSGVIVSKNGYIITNNHVVEDADEVRVKLGQNQDYVATIVGTDPLTDIAVLKIEADDLPRATLANSDLIEVGDVVFAIGNPLGIGKTVTMGIVSATGRGDLRLIRGGFEDFIQTDASINQGNSGGALVDAHGRLIGINTIILTNHFSSGNIGIGFAIPIGLAYRVFENLVETGEVARGFLGVQIEALDDDMAKYYGAPDRKGALVSFVTSGTPADTAGLRSGDIIVAIDDLEVESPRALRFAIADKSPGTAIDVVVLRNGDRLVLEASLARLGGSDPVAENSSQLRLAFSLEGVELAPLSESLRAEYGLDVSTQGLAITSVSQNSPYRDQLREGLVILKANGRELVAIEDLTSALKPGAENTLMVYSEGSYRKITLSTIFKKE